MKKHRSLLAIVTAVIAVSLGAVYWHKSLRHEFFPDNLGEVVPGKIYRSAQLTQPMIEKVVADYGIKTIIDLSVSDPPRSETIMERGVVANLPNVDRIEFSLMGDGTGDRQQYVTALSIMADPARQPVLVHCAAGAQRTGVIVMLYRHIVDGVPIYEANLESLQYGRNADDWVALAYLAENLSPIKEAIGREPLATGLPGGGDDPEP